MAGSVQGQQCRAGQCIQGLWGGEVRYGAQGSVSINQQWVGAAAARAAPARAQRRKASPAPLLRRQRGGGPEEEQHDAVVESVEGKELERALLKQVVLGAGGAAGAGRGEGEPVQGLKRAACTADPSARGLTWDANSASTTQISSADCNARSRLEASCSAVPARLTTSVSAVLAVKAHTLRGRWVAIWWLRSACRCGLRGAAGGSGARCRWRAAPAPALAPAPPHMAVVEGCICRLRRPLPNAKSAKVLPMMGP